MKLIAAIGCAKWDPIAIVPLACALSKLRELLLHTHNSVAFGAWVCITDLEFGYV